MLKTVQMTKPVLIDDFSHAPQQFMCNISDK